jgi:hypothetical protein
LNECITGFGLGGVRHCHVWSCWWRHLHQGSRCRG